MEVLNTVKGTLNTAVETLSNVAQGFVEKNRTKAKLNRLRMVMKSESELMNRAYIALGKEYYERLKNGESADSAKQQNLVEVIDNCKAKIARARDCYRRILESQNEFIYSAPAKDDDAPARNVVDITVACSNEDDYPSSPFENAAEAVREDIDEAKEAVGEKAETAKEKFEKRVEQVRGNVEGKVEHVKDVVEERVGKAKTVVGERVAKAADVVKERAEKLAEGDQKPVEEAAEAVEEAAEKAAEAAEEAAEEIVAPDTESDNEELF